MWISRLLGLLIASFGAALVSALWYDLNHPAEDLVRAVRIGVMGVVLLGPVGVAVVFFGAHLLFAPRSAARLLRTKPGRPEPHA